MEEGQECRGRRTNHLDIYTCVCAREKNPIDSRGEI